jgi:1-acyl-sn-glycerol-3-phosphate acyltransferase
VNIILSVRSALFLIALIFWTIVCGLICTITFLTFNKKIISYTGWIWSSFAITLLKYICGVNTIVSGTDNIPKAPFIIASKHQSAWETIFLLKYFKNPAFILKKELAYIPIYGWYLPLMGMVCINRSAGTKALKQTLDGVKSAFNAKRNIAIFPEGTRVKPGHSVEYKSGIYAIHKHFPEVPILPIALNSGKVWPPKSFLIKPGTVTIKFLPPINSKHHKNSLLGNLKNIIDKESEML